MVSGAWTSWRQGRTGGVVVARADPRRASHNAAGIERVGTFASAGAVLVPIVERGEPSVLFTRRTELCPRMQDRSVFPAGVTTPTTRR